MVNGLPDGALETKGDGDSAEGKTTLAIGTGTTARRRAAATGADGLLDPRQGGAAGLTEKTATTTAADALRRKEEIQRLPPDTSQQGKRTSHADLRRPSAGYCRRLPCMTPLMIGSSI
jgi:hypothetical protein